jgi:hypothetical protein
MDKLDIMRFTEARYNPCPFSIHLVSEVQAVLAVIYVCVCCKVQNNIGSNLVDCAFTCFPVGDVPFFNIVRDYCKVALQDRQDVGAQETVASRGE